MKKQFKKVITGVTVFCFSFVASAQTGSIQPPPPPNYSLCSGRPDETTCRQYLDAQYQQNLATYNQTIAAEAAARNRAQQEYESAKQAAQTSQQDNNTAKKAYNTSSIITKIISVAAAAKYAASGGTDMAALALSILMAMYSSNAKQQAGSHNTAGYNSCMLSNQISTSQSNCGPPPGTFNPEGYPSADLPDLPDPIDTTGRCIASADVCNEIISRLPPGTDLRDYSRNLSSFAGSNAPFKVNKDGTITGKNGKNYSLNDFKDPAAMAAAGMKPSDIALATNMMKNGLGSGSLDAKKDLKALAGGPGSEFADDAAARAAAAAAAKAAEEALNNDALGKRKIAAAEGLAKDFNGELIGVAGDDIWKMMNRRYRLKTAQDAFMNSAKP